MTDTQTEVIPGVHYCPDCGAVLISMTGIDHNWVDVDILLCLQCGRENKRPMGFNSVAVFEMARDFREMGIAAEEAAVAMREIAIPELKPLWDMVAEFETRKNCKYARLYQGALLLIMVALTLLLLIVS